MQTSALDNIADTPSLDTTIKKALEMLAKYSQSTSPGAQLISAFTTGGEGTPCWSTQENAG